MILLDAFRKESASGILNLLTLEEQGLCFDFNINLAFNGYRYNYLCNPFFKIKKVISKRDTLYGEAEDEAGNKHHIKFITLHFQGHMTKSLIPRYVSSDTAYQRFLNVSSSNLNNLNRRKKLIKKSLKDRLKGLKRNQ